MYPDNETNLGEIGRWRDWLWRYRAIPGTMGGASKSLLRATLHRELYCSVQWDAKRLRQSAGGIIRNGPAGQGEYVGRMVHWDMPAAYATEIGTMRYGGRWFPEANTTRQWLNHLTRQAVPVYVRARVYVPKGLPYGPLPTRPAKPLRPLMASLYNLSGKRYPVGRSIQGIWTWEEILSAEAAGCSFRVIEAWKHSAPKQSPFRFWWTAIQEGREMQGLAGLLAKVTGNALWGNFALDPSIHGRATITSCDPKKRGRKRWSIRTPKPRPFPLPAIDLAEIVAGRVRARLYDAMREAGADLVCAHTDGLWARDVELGAGWRPKDSAHRLQLLTPQHLRYWPAAGAGAPSVVYAGVPLEGAQGAFERDWGRYTEGVQGGEYLPAPEAV
jgi:hypothetical protein